MQQEHSENKYCHVERRDITVLKIQGDHTMFYGNRQCDRSRIQPVVPVLVSRPLLLLPSHILLTTNYHSYSYRIRSTTLVTCIGSKREGATYATYGTHSGILNIS